MAYQTTNNIYSPTYQPSFATQSGPTLPQPVQNNGYYAAGPTQYTPPSNDSSPDQHTLVGTYGGQRQVPQLRRPRQPLGLPAALRPTEPPITRATDIPNRPRNPDTPPPSKDNSFDSAKSPKSLSHVKFDSFPLPESSHSNLDENTEPARRMLSRAGSESIDERRSGLKTPPTRAHWKPDELATCCAICLTSFSFWFRRHHCRRCGDVVCDPDSRKVVTLDENARYHPDGMEVRGCDRCAEECEIIQSLRNIRTDSISEPSNVPTLSMPTMDIPRKSQQSEEPRVGSLARSAYDWSRDWSTF